MTAPDIVAGRIASHIESALADIAAMLKMKRAASGNATRL